MTRYARAGKGTHQRVAKDSTPWNELKHPLPERVRSNNGKGGRTKSMSKNFKKERFNKNGTRPSPRISDDNKTNDSNPEKSMSSVSDSTKNEHKKGPNRKNPNVRGFGQSLCVKIFGQYWVPADDAKRLKGLCGKLKAQGLPRKEILDALQNERRKAEKAAKRQRDKTCFQCRQFGHILSDCPNLKNASNLSNDGDLYGSISDQGLVCFKCGSTEHTSRKCRRSGENFEFAKCFICSGSGHIARQCPQNTNGIYPSGGSCGECGSTMHLKNDCPDLIGEDVPSKDDQDAVTLRMSDPFTSTEYEPVATVVKSSEPEPGERNAVQERLIRLAQAQSSTKTQPDTPKNKGKRTHDNDDDEGTTFDFDVHRIEAPVAKAKPVPQKRKIVKF